MDYDQIIPLLVAGVQEQQQTIDSLKQEVENLKMGVETANFKNLGTSSEQNIPKNNHSLFQNAPNPFTEETTIRYHIDEEDFQNAEILVFDMTGLLLKQIPISKAGKGTVTINGNEFNAGMYIYSLVVNKQEIDSKKMILLKN